MTKSSDENYESWLEYYDMVLAMIPQSQAFFSEFKIREYIQTLPKKIEPDNLLQEVSKVLLDPTTIKDFRDDTLFQNVLNITGELMLSLYILPRRSKLEIDESFRPDITPLTELYKFMVSNYEATVKERGLPTKNVNKPVYVEFLKYGLTLTYEEDLKEYKGLVNELLSMVDLPNLYMEEQSVV